METSSPLPAARVVGKAAGGWLARLGRLLRGPAPAVRHCSGCGAVLLHDLPCVLASWPTVWRVTVCGGPRSGEPPGASCWQMEATRG